MQQTGVESDVGVLAVPQQRSDHALLKRRVQEAGLLRKQPWYYALCISANLSMLGLCLILLVLLRDPWLVALDAVGLGLVSGQLGFQLHDAGHKQMFERNSLNDLVGYLTGNLLLGMSYGWWVDKHNRHHAHPNTEDKDPDIDIGALAFTAGQARAKRSRVTRFIARHQRYLFFPLLLLEAVQLHASSIQALAGRGLRHRIWETLMLGLHGASYVTVVLLVLSPLKAAVFILVQQALFGLYLGCSFAPNHKGMPMLAADDQSDFLRRQVLTARNVRGNWLVDFALGGLNYQIEHHLFPSMPRPNLRHAQPIIAQFCRQHGLSYSQTTLWRSYAQALHHLHQVGRPLRATPAG